MLLILIILYPNCSYLSNTQVVTKSSFWGSPKQVAVLQQNYYDKIRNLDVLDSSYDNQFRYYQMFSGHSQSYQDLYTAVRQVQLKPYTDNVRASERNGEISTAITATGMVVSSVSGNPIKTQVSDVHLSQNLNVVNGTSDTTVEKGAFKLNLNVNARSARDASAAEVNNTEFYQAKAEGPLALGWSASSFYGGTTGRLGISASHQLVNNFVFVVNKNWQVNPEVSGNLGYGVTF